MGSKVYFLLYTDPAIVLKKGGGLVDCLTPSPTVSVHYPLAVVTVTGNKGLFQRVLLLSLTWHSSVTKTGRHFALQQDLRQAIVIHPGDVSCPAQL